VQRGAGQEFRFKIPVVLEFQVFEYGNTKMLMPCQILAQVTKIFECLAIENQRLCIDLLNGKQHFEMIDGKIFSLETSASSNCLPSTLCFR
jgi:hypothetical protein